MHRVVFGAAKLATAIGARVNRKRQARGGRWSLSVFAPGVGGVSAAAEAHHG